DNGIRSVLIKGLAMARFYPAAEMRSFGDVDIVVSPVQFEAALRLAHEHGLHPPATDLQPHRSFDLRCREGLNLADAQGLVRLDLHHHIGPWAFGRLLTFERLHVFGETIEVHGHRVRVAGPAHSLAIALLHLISEQWQKKLSLVTWSDVAVLADRVDPHTTAQELRVLHLDWLLAAVLAELPAGACPEKLAAAVGAPAIPAGSALRLRLLDTGALVGRHPASWAVRLPVPNALWFLGGSAVPSHEYLVGRFGEDASYRMWWSQALRWAARAVRGHDVATPYSPGRT
ncbi:MAG: nucleotidyltransferase family protein, partial [Ilumatobacteraceae bacterium]